MQTTAELLTFVDDVIGSFRELLRPDARGDVEIYFYATAVPETLRDMQNLRLPKHKRRAWRRYPVWSVTDVRSSIAACMSRQSKPGCVKSKNGRGQNIADGSGAELVEDALCDLYTSVMLLGATDSNNRLHRGRKAYALPAGADDEIPIHFSFELLSRSLPSEYIEPCGTKTESFAYVDLLWCDDRRAFAWTAVEGLTGTRDGTHGGYSETTSEPSSVVYRYAQEVVRLAEETAYTEQTTHKTIEEALESLDYNMRESMHKRVHGDDDGDDDENENNGIQEAPPVSDDDDYDDVDDDVNGYVY